MTTPNPTPLVVQTVSEPTPTREVDSLVSSRHVIATTDGELCYTAQTGRVVLRDDDLTNGVYSGRSDRAEIGCTAYTLDDADPTTRPITFCFNGGPGSASIWLHMGLLGPRIIDMGEVDELARPPYRLVDNPHTLLRATDLVIIDAMSTGYSRVSKGRKATEWHGWKADVEQFTEFIRLWCTRHNRWMSPKFIIGESYGTVRGVSVAQKLQDDHGLYLNGILLLSSVLDFGSQDFDNPRWDESAIHFLPSYAAIAWYHGRHPGRTLDEVRAEAEEFADGRYRLALARGRRLDAEERSEVAQTLARLTGLSQRYVELSRLRIEHERFCAELLRDEGLVVGRIDGRFTGPAARGTEEVMNTDPSGDLTMGAYTAALHHYLRTELGSKEEANYQVAAELWKDWNYKEFQGRPVYVADKLERVMRANPDLQVRVEYGYYDLATPYFAAQDTIDHLQLPDEAFDRITGSWFETGHMPYLHGESRIRESDEQCAWIRASSGR
ncbi:MAG: S10 family peptidase [Brooklawnia sp.]